MSGDHVEVIAEAGVNHNGSLELAMRLVDVAAAAGADTVKFQTFTAARLVSEKAPLAAYQRANTGGNQTQLAMLEQLELPAAAYRELLDYCNKNRIAFLASPFDRESLDYLVRELGVSRLKIASGELTNGPLLLHFANSGCRLLLSTGMASPDEIEGALAVLAFGMMFPGARPEDLQQCHTAYAAEEGRELLRQRLTLLHCTSQYPAPAAELNLSAMTAMAKRWQLPVGYSDHSSGLAIPAAAVALGACVLEKHFTLDRNLPGPDHRASLEPDELAALVQNLRAVAAARGDGVKSPQPCELDTRAVARRSLVAAVAINAGEAFCDSNLAVRRPGSGVSPMNYWAYVGRVSRRNYLPGDLIDE